MFSGIIFIIVAGREGEVSKNPHYIIPKALSIVLKACIYLHVSVQFLCIKYVFPTWVSSGKLLKCHMIAAIFLKREPNFQSWIYWSLIQTFEKGVELFVKTTGRHDSYIF